MYDAIYDNYRIIIKRSNEKNKDGKRQKKREISVRETLRSCRFLSTKV